MEGKNDWLFRPPKGAHIQARHGTYSGYSAHYYLGFPPCTACKRAKADYDRRRRKAAKDGAS